MAAPLVTFQISQPVSLRRHNGICSALPICTTTRYARQSIQLARLQKVSTACISAPAVDTQNKSLLVDKLLAYAKNSDRGGKTTPSERESIDSIIDEISDSGNKYIPNQTLNPSLFDEYVIVYSANSKLQKSQPVGGLLRTPIGKVLFRTREIFEHFIQPNTVIQMICFRFLGIITGNVALKGKIDFSVDKMNKSEIVFQFQQPRLRLGPAVFEYGPCPRLSTNILYVDDRVRIMQGKRGSRFIFARRSCLLDDYNFKNALSDEWKMIFDAKPLPTVLLPITLVVGIVVSLFAPLFVRVMIVGLLLAVAFILKRGGTVNRNPTNLAPSN